MKKIIILFTVSLLFVGCAKDFYTNFKSPAEGEEYGSLIVRFSSPIKDVNITVNGNLVAEDKFTERVQVNNIPVGQHAVNVIASSWELKHDINVKESVDIQPNETQTVLVQIPPKSTGFWIYQAAIYLATFSATYYLVY